MIFLLFFDKIPLCIPMLIPTENIKIYKTKSVFSLMMFKKVKSIPDIP